MPGTDYYGEVLTKPSLVAQVITLVYKTYQALLHPDKFLKRRWQLCNIKLNGADRADVLTQIATLLNAYSISQQLSEP